MVFHLAWKAWREYGLSSQHLYFSLFSFPTNERLFSVCLPTVAKGQYKTHCFDNPIKQLCTSDWTISLILWSLRWFGVWNRKHKRKSQVQQNTNHLRNSSGKHCNLGTRDIFPAKVTINLFHLLGNKCWRITKDCVMYPLVHEEPCIRIFGLGRIVDIVTCVLHLLV